MGADLLFVRPLSEWCLPNPFLQPSQRDAVSWSSRLLWPSLISLEGVVCSEAGPVWGQFRRSLCKSRIGSRSPRLLSRVSHLMLQLGRNGVSSVFLVMLETGLIQALGSHCPQTLPQRLGLCPVFSIRSQMLTPLVTVRSCTEAPVHLSPVPTGCPSPSSRAVCHGPVMGTATASQWSITASRQPSTSRPVSLTSLFSRRLTLQLVGELWKLGCWTGAKMKAAVWTFPNLPPCRVPRPYYLSLYH